MTAAATTLTVIVVITMAIGCAAEREPLPPLPEIAIDETTLTALGMGSCMNDEPPSPRPQDPAAHVYDSAVSSYLHRHASGIGRRTQGDENRKALAVTDEAVYHVCVQGPENCLRAQLAQADENRETLALLKTEGAYAHERALQCLVREGEIYQGDGNPEAYRERIAVHLVGTVLPVGMLRETDYYGDASPERLEKAQANRERCRNLIAADPPDQEGIAQRIERDILATTDCGEGETRNRQTGEEMEGADKPTSQATPALREDTSRMAGYDATKEPNTNPGNAHRYDCHDAFIQAGGDIRDLMKSIEGDYVELLNCREVLQMTPETVNERTGRSGVNPPLLMRTD